MMTYEEKLELNIERCIKPIKEDLDIFLNKFPNTEKNKQYWINFINKMLVG